MNEDLDSSPPLSADSLESQLTRALMDELVRFRKKRKIGQEPIAKAMGVTQARISQMENLKSGTLSMEGVLLYAKSIGAEITIAPEKPARTRREV